MADEDLEGLIRYYFFRGFEYVQIFNFLARYHGKVISERTFHTVWKTERTPLNYDITEIEAQVRQLLDV